MHRHILSCALLYKNHKDHAKSIAFNYLIYYTNYDRLIYFVINYAQVYTISYPILCTTTVQFLETQPLLCAKIERTGVPHSFF